MNRALCAALLVLVGTKAHLTAARPEILRTVRVLTYNVHHGEGTDGQFDLPRLAQVIASAFPDLVALQEVDEGTERSSGVHQLEELARLTGMHAVFGKAMDFQGGGYGVAVLSRGAIVHAENHALPGSPGREPRTALTVDVDTGDGGPWLTFTSTHLDQGRDVGNKIAQVGDLNERLARGDDAPSILAGDFNSRPDTDAIQLLDGRWTDVSPADPPGSDRFGRPQGRVDYVLVRPEGRWRVIEATVLDARIASDHRPVLVVLEWID